MHGNLHTMKKCSECKVEKDPSEFHKRKDSKDGLQGKCKKCNTSKVRKWQEDNPEQYETIWKKNSFGPEYRLRKRARVYGLSVEQLSKMLDDSDGVCEICRKPPKKWLVVDHCHLTLKVRGILCEGCNKALGFFKDDIGVMEAAILYLKK